MKLTKPQQNLFWRAFVPAWRARREEQGIAPADAEARDAWRHGVILQETGRGSLAEVERGAEFDRLLKRLSVEAGDFARAADMEAAEAGRIRARCEDCLRQICEIDGPDPHASATAPTAARWAYVGRLAARAFGGRAWDDIPERDLARVFMMLDTHRRRLLRRAGWMGARFGQPLGFPHGARYRRAGLALEALAQDEVPA